MRSGKIWAKNDYLIEELIKDPDFLITDDGKIYGKNNSQGHRTQNWHLRKFGSKKTINGIYKNFKYKNKGLQVHRIIYAKFIGKLESDLVINHIDNNPSNNDKNNLELVTQSENNKHRYVSGLAGIITNRRHSDDTIRSIRNDRKNGMKYSEICKKYDICKSQCSYICNNKTWKNIK